MPLNPKFIGSCSFENHINYFSEKIKIETLLHFPFLSILVSKPAKKKGGDGFKKTKSSSEGPV